MAFSDSPLTVQRMLPYLGPLLEGRETIWRTEPRRSKWFAYRVREALFAARENPEAFPELSRLSFRVEVLSHNEVRAVPKIGEAEAVSIVTRPSDARMETGEITSAEQIVRHWKGLAPEIRSKVYFPNADIGPEDLEALWNWAQREGVLIFENLGAITLLPLEGNEDSAAFAFDPSDIREGRGFEEGDPNE